ncbi:MAG: class I SAM-dependent methyltransferase [bacterium]|nr:class I SAM-dependent methyltransferase [bacterium]MCP5067689.1 class I SAM-dependent methyltransferase [bacterium]
MKITSMLAALRASNPLTIYRFMGDLQAMVRMHFLHTASDSGLLQALSDKPTRETLVERLGVQRPEILDAVLDAGLAAGELSCSDGRYALRGKRSRALAASDSDPLVAMVQANATYYNKAYRLAAARMKGAPRGDDLAEIGDLVARASRVGEPFLRAFVRETVSGRSPMRILEVGCGSGALLRCAADVNPDAVGVGIDLDAAAVEQAQDNLAQWKIGDRFRVISGDVRQPPPELKDAFDLITLYNIIYYFPEEERLELIRALRERLSPGGTLALVTTTQGRGGDPMAANLNLVTSSLNGCTPLPELDDLLALFDKAGLTEIRHTKLIPGSSLIGITARSS